MVEQVREELKELCEKILQGTSESYRDHLSNAQMLYEKLLVLNYLEESAVIPRAEKTPSPALKAPLPAVEDTEEPAMAHGKDNFINESPVADEELTDDKTPEQLGPILSALTDIRAEGKSSPRKASINDKLKQGSMKVGLNDRLAFVRHLFQGNQEDFNRVVSQINTFEDYEEAENFLETIVKPDYDWSRKEEYELRFIQLMRNRFGLLD